jgi:hypothetical protein
MSRFRFVGLIALAMTMLAGVLSSAAAAENVQFEVETGKAFPQEFKGKSGLGSLLTVGKKTIVCKSDKFTGTITGSGTASNTGTAKIDFEECESSGFKCNSFTSTAKDAAGVILVNVKAAPVWITATGTLAGILFSPETSGGNFAQIECTALVKIVVKGELLCNFSPENTFVKTATIKCREKEEGKSLYTKYSTVLPVSEQTVKPLLSEFNGSGAFEESALANEETLESTNNIKLKT